jgi:hypothetical protein
MYMYIDMLINIIIIILLSAFFNRPDIFLSSNLLNSTLRFRYLTNTNRNHAIHQPNLSSRLCPII